MQQRRSSPGAGSKVTPTHLVIESTGSVVALFDGEALLHFGSLEEALELCELTMDDLIAQV